MQELDYFGKEYKTIPTYMHIRSTIRKHINSGGFYCIAISEKYKKSIISFLSKNYNLSESHKIKSYNINFVLFDLQNQKEFLDNIFILLHSNNLIDKPSLEKYFINEIKQIYGVDFVFSRYTPEKEQDQDVVQNSLIGSFDLDTIESPIVERVDMYEKINPKYLLNVIPVLDSFIDINLFYTALCNWSSQSQEIIEVVNKGLN